MDLISLPEWIQKNAPDQSLIFKNSFWNQMDFLKNLVSRAVGKERTFVIGEHISKSILFPVILIRTKDYDIIFRGNLYDWKVSFESYADVYSITRLSLFDPSTTIEHIYCEGFDKKWVHQPYKDNQRKFTFEVRDSYDLYVFIKTIKGIFEDK